MVKEASEASFLAMNLLSCYSGCLLLEFGNFFLHSHCKSNRFQSILWYKISENISLASETNIRKLSLALSMLRGV